MGGRRKRDRQRLGPFQDLPPSEIRDIDVLKLLDPLGCDFFNNEKL
jgi:hypothetical protein